MPSPYGFVGDRVCGFVCRSHPLSAIWIFFGAFSDYLQGPVTGILVHSFYTKRFRISYFSLWMFGGGELLSATDGMAQSSCPCVKTPVFCIEASCVYEG
ncbi:hypothetical protein U1Q18_051499 [Sarracenia purpurea var. burkii]